MVLRHKKISVNTGKRVLILSYKKVHLNANSLRLFKPNKALFYDQRTRYSAIVHIMEKPWMVMLKKNKYINKGKSNGSLRLQTRRWVGLKGFMTDQRILNPEKKHPYTDRKKAFWNEDC